MERHRLARGGHCSAWIAVVAVLLMTAGLTAQEQYPRSSSAEPLTLGYRAPQDEAKTTEETTQAGEPWVCSGCGEDISDVPPYGFDGEHPLCANCYSKFEETKTTTKTTTSGASEPYDLLRTQELTGDWFGIRPQLKDVGVNFAPMLVTNYQQNFRGGLETSNADDITGRFFYSLELDFDKMGLVPGGSFFFRAFQQWHDGIGDEVGTTIAPYWGSGAPGNNFYGDRRCIIVDKWWWRQRFWDNRIEIRAGKLLNILDLFDRNTVSGAYTTRFMNRAFNYNQTIPIAKGGGLYFNIWPVDWMYFRTAAITSDARGTRMLDWERVFHGRAHYVGNWEFGFKVALDSANGEMPGNYRFGWWYNPRIRTRWKNTFNGRLPNNETGSGDVGFYINFDQMVWKENNDAKDKQGLSAFLRYGYAHGDFNRLEHAWNLGAAYVGLIPERDKDVLGFGVAQAMQSEDYRDLVDSRADRETAYEIFYSIYVFPWLEIAPDVQFITNPGGDKDARDSIVGGIRAKIKF